VKYCTNCGKPFEVGVKFCPYCGTKVMNDSNLSKNPSPKKQKMEKGVVKSLNDDENIDEELLLDDLEESSEDATSLQSLPSTTIGIYFILNFILMMGNSSSDEIMGIFIYTWVVLAIIFIRQNKEKPFNWLLNIFISLQGILVFSTGMITMEYLDAGSDSVGSIIQLGLLVLLLMSIISLLYNGNKKSS